MAKTLHFVFQGHNKKLGLVALASIGQHVPNPYNCRPHSIVVQAAFHPKTF
jgi:hypothetical protein